MAGRGRPTEYTPELGEQILSHMEQGLSLTAAAALCDVHRQRVYEWEARHPDFAEDVKLGRAKRQAFLERRLMAAADGPIVTSSIFALKNTNPDDWRDKREVEHSGGIETTTKEQRDAAVAAASRANS